MAAKHKDRGNALLKSGKAAEAAQAYTDAVALTPYNHVLYGNRAAARLQCGHHVAALRDAQRSASLDPSYLKAYSRISTAYCGMGRILSALDACRAALEIMADAGEGGGGGGGAAAADLSYFRHEAARLEGVAQAALRSVPSPALPSPSTPRVPFKVGGAGTGAGSEDPAVATAGARGDATLDRGSASGPVGGGPPGVSRSRRTSDVDDGSSCSDSSGYDSDGRRAALEPSDAGEVLLHVARPCQVPRPSFQQLSVCRCCGRAGQL
jgi:hypothetical protein